MAKQAIGLDIGTDAVRVAEVRLGTPPTLVRLGQIALPPGAVVEGQVVEPGEVAGAIRQLLKQCDIDGKSVHIGVPTSRVIVRTVETGDLPDSELRSAIGFELEDHLPLSAVDAAYDVLPLDRVETEQGWRRRVLLAAAPLDAIRPSVAAVQQAGRRVVSINVAPLALARLFPPSSVIEFDGTSRASVDMLVSLGAGTMTVLVTVAGSLLFNRTTASPIGTRLTEGIEEQLAVGREVAELAKRRVVTDENRHLVAMATALSDLKVSELLDEVQDSLDYYRSQAFARPIDRIVLTGGGALLSGLEFHLASRFGCPVVVGDPYQRVAVSLPKVGPEQRLALAPFVSTAIAFGLDAIGTAPRIDLSPPTASTATATPGKPILLVLGVAAAVGVAGLTWTARSEAGRLRNDTTAVRGDIETATVQLASLQARSKGTLTKGELRTIVEAADGVRFDWVTAIRTLESISAPLGVSVSDFSANRVVSTPPPGSEQPALASIAMTGQAPSLEVIAIWIEAIEADPRFVAVASRSASEENGTPGAPTTYTFEAVVHLTGQALLKPLEEPTGEPEPSTTEVAG